MKCVPVPTWLTESQCKAPTDSSLATLVWSSIESKWDCWYPQKQPLSHQGFKRGRTLSCIRCHLKQCLSALDEFHVVWWLCHCVVSTQLLCQPIFTCQNTTQPSFIGSEDARVWQNTSRISPPTRDSQALQALAGSSQEECQFLCFLFWKCFLHCSWTSNTRCSFG